MGPESVTDLVAVLYRRRFVILMVLAGAIAGAWLYLDMVPKTWRAVASVFIQARPTGLSLNSANVNIPAGPIVPDTRLETSIGIIGVAAGGTFHKRIAELVPEADSRVLRRNVVLDIDRFKQLNVTAYDAKPARAVLLANKGVQAVQEILSEMVRRDPERNLELFKEREKEAWARFEDARNRRLAYLDALGTPDHEVEVTHLFQDKERYEAQLESLEREAALREAERPIIERMMAERPEFILASQSLGRNGAYSSLIARIADLETEIAVTSLDLMPDHPTMKVLEARLGAARDQLKREVEMVHTGSSLRLDDVARDLLNDLVDFKIAESSVEVQRAMFQNLLNYTLSKLGDVPLDRVQLEAFESEMGRARKLAEDLGDRIYEIELQLARGLDFTWTDAARTATIEDAKQVPGRSGVFIFAAISALIAGVLLALGMELIAQLGRNRPY